LRHCYGHGDETSPNGKQTKHPTTVTDEGTCGNGNSTSGGCGGPCGGGPGNGGGSGGGGRTPNKITCSTVLPDGSTVGSHVNSVVNSLNDSAQISANTDSTAVAEAQTGSNPISAASEVYSGTNFRAMYGGPGADYTLLGDAGNFAYFAVSADIGVPLGVAEFVAGVYSITHHPSSDWVGPFGMDPSATRNISAYGVTCP
jgi:hypothetical protein